MRVCVIPARGGSKRIAHKNIRLFAGRPILSHAIECAQRSALFDRVIVSTDSEQIAQVAKESGAEVPFKRPLHLADDHTGTMPVIQHAIQQLNAGNPKATWVCCLYPTSPLLSPTELEQAWLKLQHTPCTMVFSATTFAFPIQRALRYTDGGGVEPLYPEFIAARSQDLEPVIHDAGQFYFGTADRFLNGPNVFHPSSRPLLLPRQRVVDIDTEEDWLHAEALYQVLQQKLAE